jgi:hypothetical protein
MKANKIQIALVGSAVVFAGTPAFATEISGTRITSQRGVSQAEWEATDLYKSHTCPNDAGKGIGVDMNFTADRSDDTWFVYCDKREVAIQIPIYKTDTPTAVSTTSSNTNTITTMAETSTVLVETKTVTTQETATITTTTSNNNSVMVQEWVIEIKRLINQLLALMARIKK